MRRFDTPTAPPGWAGQGATLIRIVDPTGRAIAWLAPDFGASCVGYAVRDEDIEQGGWRQVLHASSPRELRADPLACGVTVLGPEPEGRGSAHLARWRFAERDPTAATCVINDNSLRLELAARLEDAALHLELRATNVGTAPISIELGLGCRLASDFRPLTQHTTGAQPPTFMGQGRSLRCWHELESPDQHWESSPETLGATSRAAGNVAIGATLRCTLLLMPG